MEHLSEQIMKAETRIAQAEMAVMRQIAQIDKLRVAGQSTTTAERILLAFVGSLEGMREYRKLIAHRSSRKPDDNQPEVHRHTGVCRILKFKAISAVIKRGSSGRANGP
jgi:hypothetical protein